MQIRIEFNSKLNRLLRVARCAKYERISSCGCSFGWCSSRYRPGSDRLCVGGVPVAIDISVRCRTTRG